MPKATDIAAARGRRLDARKERIDREVDGLREFFFDCLSGLPPDRRAVCAEKIRVDVIALFTRYAALDKQQRDSRKAGEVVSIKAKR